MSATNSTPLAFKKIAEELRQQFHRVSRRKSEREAVALIEAVGAADQIW